MKILQTIKERKLEMINENRSLDIEKAQLSARLNQINAKQSYLDVELNVLANWEIKLTPKEESNAGK